MAGIQQGLIGSLYGAVGDFESIATQTVSGGATNTVTFSSIPATYSHLQLRYILRTNRTDDYIDILGMTFNSDTASNYNNHLLNTENGGGVAAGYVASTSARYHLLGATALSNTNVFAAGVIDILDYANTNKYKTTRSINGFSNNQTNHDWLGLESSLWRSTSAINRIDFTIVGGTYLTALSTFALYGIKG